MVFKHMEQLIKTCRQKKGDQSNLFEEQIDDDSELMPPSIGPEKEMEALAQIILSTIEDWFNKVPSLHVPYTT